MLNKLKLLSLIFTVVFLAACSSSETKDTDAVSDVDTQAAEEAAATAATEAEAEVEEVAQMLTVYYFEYDQSSIDADTSDALDVVATALKNTTATVRLEGHADERGTREYNMALGERRANAIKRYLTAQGVAASQIEVISYGEEKPVMQGSDEAAMAKNRRVELVK